MPESWYYLAALVGCIVVTLPLEFVLGARVYRNPRRTLKAIAPVFVLFAAWDLAATARGHWWFSERYTVGARAWGLPLEEWLFFIVVPLCGLLTYEAVKNVARLGSGENVARLRSGENVARLGSGENAARLGSGENGAARHDA